MMIGAICKGNNPRCVVIVLYAWDILNGWLFVEEGIPNGWLCLEKDIPYEWLFLEEGIPNECFVMQEDHTATGHSELYVRAARQRRDGHAGFCTHCQRELRQRRHQNTFIH